MHEEYTNETLTAVMVRIEKKLDDGFKGVHERQDKTNGNVKINTESRLKNIHIPKIVYGGVGLILTAFVGGVITLVIK